MTNQVRASASPRAVLRKPAFTPTALLLCLLLLAPKFAGAHERTTSYSTWDIRGLNAKVTLRMTLLDASRFPWFSEAGSDRLLEQYITQHLTLAAASNACPVASPPRRLESAPERLVFEWTLACPAPGPLAIRSDLLLDVAPTHLHFSRVSVDGSSIGERVFSETQRVWSLSTGGPAGQQVGTSFAEYVVLGIGHILTGYDHLAFLLVLLLLGQRGIEVAKIVTGFTIGHSITLALASLGVLHPARGVIEALIGLSIALVAIEDLWLMGQRPAIVPWLVSGLLALLAIAARSSHGIVPAVTLAGLAVFSLSYFNLVTRTERPWRLRWTVAFLFGLIHGFGFASVLIEAELPGGRLAQALMGFNLGVELGQIAIIVLIWPLTLLATRALSPRTRVWALELTSTAVLALGVFWFVARAYG